MLVIKLMDKFLKVIEELCYFILFIMACIVKWVKDYRYTILAFSLIALMFIGGLYGYLLRMDYIYN